MSERCTSDEVLAVMSVLDVPDNADLSAFIAVASPYVDDIEDKDHSRMTDAKLKSVERYLAAHFAALRYKHSQETKIGDQKASDRYDIPLSTGFKSTYYGQQACKLDLTKTLEQIDLTSYSFSSDCVELNK